MKAKFLLPIVLLAVIVVLAISLAHEVAQNRRLSQALKSLKAPQPAMNSRQQLPNKRYVTRSALDERKHSPAQLRDAEQLYQVANQKWGTPEAKESLQAMIQKYGDINRTGCALLFLAEMSQGDERARHLQFAIERYSDCIYGDGVQVGAYARFLLAGDYKREGESAKAKELCDEIRAKYGCAVDHDGNLLADSLPED